LPVVLHVVPATGFATLGVPDIFVPALDHLIDIVDNHFDDVEIGRRRPILEEATPGVVSTYVIQAVPMAAVIGIANRN
jgi:hypothetical protein